MPELIEEIKWFQERGTEGYEILTNEQSILLGVVQLEQGGLSCCTEWGYFFTNPHTDTIGFVGAELQQVVLSERCMYDAYILNEPNVNSHYVNIVTNRGILQFVVWHDVSMRRVHEPLRMKIDCFQLSCERLT
jgi:hypothetical protein